MKYFQNHRKKTPIGSSLPRVMTRGRFVQNFRMTVLKCWKAIEKFYHKQNKLKCMATALGCFCKTL